MRRRVTFIEGVGASIGPIVVVFVLAALLALRAHAARPAGRAALSASSTARTRAGSTRGPIPRAGGLAIAAAFLLVAGGFVVPQRAGRLGADAADHRDRPTSSPCSSAAPAAAVLGAHRRPVRPARPLAARSARSCWRCSRSRSGIGIAVINNPFGDGVIRFSEAVLGRLHGLLDRRDDQQHQLDRRARRAVAPAIALIAVGHARAHQPHDAGQPAAHRRAVLRAGRARCSGSCAGTSTRPRSSAARAASSSSATRWPCCRSSGRRRSRSRCSSSACRSSTRSGSSSAGVAEAGRRSAPDRSHIHHRLLDLGPVAPRHRAGHLRDLRRARGAGAARCTGCTQLYAFLGVFIVSGLVLFGPTRGAFDRPEELEAESYENDGEPADRGRARSAPERPGASIARTCPWISPVLVLIAVAADGRRRGGAAPDGRERDGAAAPAARVAGRIGRGSWPAVGRHRRRVHRDVPAPPDARAPDARPGPTAEPSGPASRWPRPTTTRRRAAAAGPAVVGADAARRRRHGGLARRPVSGRIDRRTRRRGAAVGARVAAARSAVPREGMLAAAGARVPSWSPPSRSGRGQPAACCRRPARRRRRARREPPRPTRRPRATASSPSASVEPTGGVELRRPSPHGRGHADADTPPTARRPRRHDRRPARRRDHDHPATDGRPRRRRRCRPQRPGRPRRPPPNRRPTPTPEPTPDADPRADADSDPGTDARPRRPSRRRRTRPRSVAMARRPTSHGGGHEAAAATLPLP